jgi:signal transduction histidine kinase
MGRLADKQSLPHLSISTRPTFMADQEQGPPLDADPLARLARLESDFNRAVESAKLEALVEFAAGAGHEINNPLTVISGRAQLLLRDETDPERRHALALIVAQAMRIHEMIADLMLFARPPQPEIRPAELVQLLDDLAADLLPACSRQEIEIRRLGTPGPIALQADPVQLQVAFRAICRNAIEAIGSGGHIEIEVGKSQPAGEAWVCIRDDGPGMASEERRHLFDPFYSARQAGRGLGLGLCKAWRIVQNHGGRIEVQSEPRHGTTVTVALPTEHAKCGRPAGLG